MQRLFLKLIFCLLDTHRERRGSETYNLLTNIGIHPFDVIRLVMKDFFNPWQKKKLEF